MREIEIEVVRKRITTAYQKGKKILMAQEKQYLLTKGADVKADIAKSRGYLDGLSKGLEALEITANDNPLPFGKGY